MAKNEPISRKYNMDDLIMLEKAQVFHDNFDSDKPYFENAYPQFADPFATEFQAVIDDADALPLDIEVESEIVIVTEQLEAKMEEARIFIKKFFSYVDIAFSSDAKRKSFGTNRYEKARKSQILMKELLETAHRKAIVTADQNALIAAGFSIIDIADLENMANAIDLLNAQQEDLKTNRVEMTENRVIAYNAVWDYMVKINNASKVIFIDSPAKLSIYMLYPTQHSSLSKPQNLTAVVDPADPVHINIDFDAVQDATEYRLYGSIVNIGDPSGTFTELTTGATTHFDAQLTVGKRNYWKVRAFNATQSSAYSDEIWLDG
jgi:hypothetical protein